MERTAAAAVSMQKGEEPISEPNWAAKRPFVRSVAGPSIRVRVRPFYVEMWLVMFPNENGDWGGTSNRERKESRNTDFTARWNMKVTITTNLIAAMSLKSETRIRHRDRETAL